MNQIRTATNELVFEVDGREFLLAYLRAAPKDRVEFRHPAGMPSRKGVLGRDALTDSVTITTISHELADRARRNIDRLLRDRGGFAAPGEFLCRTCGEGLKPWKETAGAWRYYCPRCMTTDLWGKKLVGGTLGQGDKDE